MEAIVPSGSVAEKVTVTVWPVVAGLGVGAFTVTVGGRSFTVSMAVMEPVPALFVADTVMVKTLLVVVPVEV